MEQSKTKNSPIELCSWCKQEKDHKWVKVSAGQQKLIRFCCQKLKSSKQTGFALHKYKDAVAFGHDKSTGEPVAIDKKGKRFDPMTTRYAEFPEDNFGWKATGKVKPKKTYHI